VYLIALCVINDITFTYQKTKKQDCQNINLIKSYWMIKV